MSHTPPIEIAQTLYLLDAFHTNLCTTEKHQLQRMQSKLQHALQNPAFLIRRRQSADHLNLAGSARFWRIPLTLARPRNFETGGGTFF